jgi:hypothetical protein
MKILPTLIFLCLTTTIAYGQKSHANLKDEKDTLTLLTIGLPSTDLYQYIKTAPKYNFKLIWIDGCTVDQKTIDSMHKHNQVVDSLLDIINEVGWRDKYEKEVKERYSRDSTLIVNLKRDKLIKKQLAEQKKHGNGLQFYVDSVIDNNTFRIQVHGYLNDKYGSRGSYYRIIMRYSDLKIISIDDSLIVLSKPPTKSVSIPSYNNNTSYWYKYIQNIVQKTNKEDLLKTKKYNHLRVWTEKQFIDVSYNFRGYEFATVTNFTTSKRTGKIHSHTDIVNEDSILVLIDGVGPLEIPSEEEISCWGKRNGDPATRGCNDGITYSIEFSTDTTYSFKSYSCPSSWDCKEAAKIDSFFKQLEHLLKLEHRFDKFIQTLPKDCYDNGMIYLRCTDKK